MRHLTCYRAPFTASPLEPELRLEIQASGVDDRCTKARPLGCNQTERRRIKILSSIYEIRMVQEIDCRCFELQSDPFGERDSLDDTQIRVKVLRPIEAVYREIPELARSRSSY